MNTVIIVTVRDEESREKYMSSEEYYSIPIKCQEVRVIVGKESIFQTIHEEIESIIKNKLYGPDTNIIYMHDDVEILSSSYIFKKCLEYLEDKNTGFIGVAGTQLFKPSCIWWEGLGTVPSPLAGIVYHGNTLDKMYPTYYGNNVGTPVVVLDGVFLGAKLKTWASINLKKPKAFKGNWDFYDINWTFQAHKKGLVNKVVPVTIRHGSSGEVAGRDSWHCNKEAFKANNLKHLPAVVK